MQLLMFIVNDVDFRLSDDVAAVLCVMLLV